MEGTPDELAADLVFVNGNVVTVDPEESRVEALAVKDGKFLMVSADDHVLKSLLDMLIGDIGRCRVKSFHALAVTDRCSLFRLLKNNKLRDHDRVDEIEVGCVFCLGDGDEEGT